MKLWDRIITGNTGYVSPSQSSLPDLWPLEILLDALSAAHRVPLRVFRSDAITANVDGHADTALPTFIKSAFGSFELFLERLTAMTDDPIEGISRLKDEPEWDDLIQLSELVRNCFVSYTDPFWVVMKQQDLWMLWERLWCLRYLLEMGTIHCEKQTVRHATYGGIFSEACILSWTSMPSKGLVLLAGPSWKRGVHDSLEPGVAGNAGALVGKLSALDDHICLDSRDRLSHSRLRRFSVNRPPIRVDDLDRRLLQLTWALDVCLDIESKWPMSVTELVSSALAICLLARKSSAFQYASTVLLPLDCGDAPASHRWLLVSWPAGSEPTVALAPVLVDSIGKQATEMALGVTLASRSDVSEDKRELQRGRLLEGYATTRAGYLRERMHIIRLWIRDYFARWLTTKDLSEEVAFTEVADQIAKWLGAIFVADRCALYQYDAGERQLSRLGLFDRSQDHDIESRRREHTSIRHEGVATDSRVQSLLYKSIDEGKVIVVDAHNAHNCDTEWPCRIICPISIFGRPWGLIELRGRRIRQFTPSSSLWVEEIARIIGPFMYYESFLAALHRIDQSILARHEGFDSTKQDKYDVVVREVTRLFLSSAGALYLRHPRRTAEFECVAHFARPEARAGSSVSGFHQDDIACQTARFLQNPHDVWYTGEIGKPPFDGDWIERPAAKALLDDGHRYIAIIPLRDRTGRLHGSITLTSKEPGGYEPRWTYLVSFAVEHTCVLLQAIALTHRKEDINREYMAHALKTRVSRISGATDNITDILKPLFKEPSDTAIVSDLLSAIDRLIRDRTIDPRKLSKDSAEALRALHALFDVQSSEKIRLALFDMEQHASDLKNVAAYLSGDAPNQENPFETTDTTWKWTPARARACLLSCVKPVADDQQRFITIPTPHELPSNLFFNISELVLTEIFNNFIDNGLKYRVRDTPLIIRFKKQEGSDGVLEFRNLAPPLSDDEEELIFERGYRSAYAMTCQQDGQGTGLAFNKDVANRWGMSIKHSHDKVVGANVWHAFALLIPASLLRYDVI